MDEFASESSIGGVSVFHSSEPKKVRKAWIFVYFFFFFLLGFYVWHIYNRYKVEPEFFYKFSELPLQEIPFPAVTVCHPLFARNESVNLQKFLKNPTLNLTFEQQNLLAANVQACAPELGPKIHHFCPLVNTQNTIEVLKLKFLDINNAFDKIIDNKGCNYNLVYTKCSNLFNYVPTDFGFCFSFNLEGFQTIFNTRIISDDFKTYSREGKIVKNYYARNLNHKFFINEANQSIDWNLEKGFLTNSKETLPVRAMYKKYLTFYAKLTYSDLINLCPKMGRSLSLFLHLPNEILTPFHQPLFIKSNVNLFLKAKLHKTDESLRTFPPEKRNCFFEDEKKLKYFKSYTKALCEFECLANLTLNQCGCVKFSMPREKSTRICGLNETSCYIQVAKNWNLTCGCLQSCTYIQYYVEKEFKGIFQKQSNNIIIRVRMLFEKIFDEKVEIFGVYSLFQCFADFGSMLGIFFGASFISIIEIFYFLTMSFIKRKYNIQESSLELDITNFASSSTIHGFQFIFKKSSNKFVRMFWMFAFIFAFSCCIYNSRESYWKLNVVPETESSKGQISLREIPFPAIQIYSPLFEKENLTVDYWKFLSKFNKKLSSIKELNSEQYFYLITNTYWRSPNLLQNYISAYKQYVQNITVNFTSHRSDVDLFPYLNQSHLEVDELFFDCKYQEVSTQCSKLFKKVMTIGGICYAFNMQSFREIFNEKLSKNFDSYGKFDKIEEPQWSLDQGYFTNKTDQNPKRAIQKGNFDFNLRISKSFQRFDIKLSITLPNEILTHFSYWEQLFYNFQFNFKLTAKKKQTKKSLRKFSPENRGCYFQDERKLQFFKNYLRSNCILECLTNVTLQNCGCVAFLLPHNNSTNICDSADDGDCYNLILKHFPPINDSLNPCGCLPNCNDIQYNYDVVQKPHKTKIENFHVINVKLQFVGGSEIIEEEIHLAFGLQDFFTNVGGFLGLYLGCSFISVIEVFYFCFEFVLRKLTRKGNRVEAADIEEKPQDEIFNEEKEFSDGEEDKILENHNLGLTLVEIFDLEEFYEFRSPSACFG